MSEINPGVWDGLTPDQVRKYYPDEWVRFVGAYLARYGPPVRAAGEAAPPSDVDLDLNGEGSGADEGEGEGEEGG